MNTIIDGIEFECNGYSVGYFIDTVTMNSDGVYRYMPYRGPGHYEMVNQIKESGYADLSCINNGKAVSFIAVGLPKDSCTDGNLVELRFQNNNVV